MNKSYEGLLLVNKTFKKPSFSIIAQLKRVLFIKKIGHAGILDPLATGLMVILIGRNFTKKSDNIKFGIILDKFINRVLSGIQMLSDDNPRNARKKLRFSKLIVKKDNKAAFSGLF